jgi:hypothetical protein
VDTLANMLPPSSPCSLPERLRPRYQSWRADATSEKSPSRDCLKSSSRLLSSYETSAKPYTATPFLIVFTEQSSVVALSYRVFRLSL